MLQQASKSITDQSLSSSNKRQPPTKLGAGPSNPVKPPSKGLSEQSRIWVVVCKAKPKPFKVRVSTFQALQIHQSFFPNPLVKSKQHLTAHHFLNGHKSRMEIPILTISAASAPMRRCLSNWNLSHCQIKWFTVS
jgi:hypothetical protein